MATIGDSGNSTRRILGAAERGKSSAFERLSSGVRIVRASDDAAGLAIATQLANQASSARVAQRNINDGFSAANIADGALQQVSDISTRLSELAAQASNGTLSDDQRGVLNAEYQQLTQEITRIAETTEFNGRRLLQGEDISIQASGSPVNISAPNLQNALESTNISSLENARAALDETTSFVNEIASARSELGASTSRLSASLGQAEVEAVNKEAAASRIRDADIATETARLTADNIRSQVAAALSAQRDKIDSTGVLSLLRA